MQKIKILFALLLFIWAISTTYILVRDPIKDQINRHLSEKISFFMFPTFEERINNPFGGYNGRVYVFEFKDFDKVIGCNISSTKEFLKTPYFGPGLRLYGAVHFLPPKDKICVKSINDKDERAVLISHKGGLVYFSYFGS